MLLNRKNNENNLIHISFSLKHQKETIKEMKKAM